MHARVPFTVLYVYTANHNLVNCFSPGLSTKAILSTCHCLPGAQVAYTIQQELAIVAVHTWRKREGGGGWPVSSK